MIIMMMIILITIVLPHLIVMNRNVILVGNQERRVSLIRRAHVRI